MKHIILVLTLFSVFSVQAKSIYDFNLKTASGERLSLEKFKGRAVLIVNIAGNDNHKNQLGRLEKVYQSYKDQGLIVIGIPSNDFGFKKPQTIESILSICKKYNVSFPITSFVKVKESKGGSISSLYDYLESVSGGREVAWNFTKFIFDKKGKFVKRYSTTMSVTGSLFVDDIKKAINPK